MKKLLLLIFLLHFIIPNNITFAQSNINKGFRFGLEVKNFITEDVSGFNNSFGFTFGLFTAINLHSYSSGRAILLKTELNYVRYQHHNPGSKYYNIDTFDINWNGLPYTVIDEKYIFNVIEFAFIPSYYLQINKETSLEFFIGPSFGIGNKDVELINRDQNNLLFGTHYDYTEGFILPISMTSGFSLIYKPIIVDVRYKYINLVNDDRVNDFTNIYFHLGIIF